MQKLKVKYGGNVGREVGQHLFMDLWGDRISSCWKALANHMSISDSLVKA